MAFSLSSYRFRGQQAEGRAMNLSDALNDLSDFWDSRPSLVMHAWGVVTFRITIAGKESVFEITDPKLIDELQAGNYQPLYDRMAADMGLGREEAMKILSESTDVQASVDRLRPRAYPDAWNIAPASRGKDVLPDATTVWVKELSREIDAEIRRGRGRPRSARGRQIVELAVALGKRKKLSDTRLSELTGIPRSTLRDTRNRMKREERIDQTFAQRKPGERLTEKQVERVQEELADQQGNAAATARALGLPPRTVREVRARTERAEKTSSGRHTEETKARVIELVRSGMNATEAGRTAGVPGRTARGWVLKDRFGDS